jgi:hypothetical protein
MKTKEKILISLLPTQYNESTLEQVFTPIKLKAVLSAMEEYASQSKWVSVKERLPKEWMLDMSDVCLTIDKEGKFDVNHYDYALKNWTGTNRYREITHWQLLPAAPKP